MAEPDIDFSCELFRLHLTNNRRDGAYCHLFESRLRRIDLASVIFHGFRQQCEYLNSSTDWVRQFVSYG